MQTLWEYISEELHSLQVDLQLFIDFLFLFTFLLALVASGVYAATSSQAPFELVLAANPLVITSFLPFASPAIHAHNCDTYTLLTIVSS